MERSAQPEPVVVRSARRTAAFAVLALAITANLVSPGTQLWIARYGGLRNNLGGDSVACCVAASPNGKLVFVTGYSSGRYSENVATVAYNAATGKQVWLRRFTGPDNLGDSATSLAVSPGGRTVYITGHTTGKFSGQDYLTVAYNAATGATRWLRRYNGPFNGMDTANSVAVSPNGGRVYVTGSSMVATAVSDYATVAYSAATGRQLWVRRYKGPGNNPSEATSVAVSPRGDEVFVTGTSLDKNANSGYATVAYSAATGAQLWAKRYIGPGIGSGEALSMAVGPAGNTLFITGYTTGANNLPEFTTIAYNVATGTARWLRSYSSPYDGPNIATKVAVSPSGSTVYVTGSAYGKTSVSTTVNYATIAYDAATGNTLWLRQYTGPGGDSEARSVAVSPHGNKVYVTGFSYATGTLNDYATIAYDAASGAQLWLRRYNGPAGRNDGASCVAVNPISGAVYVTGESQGRSGSADYLTIGYSG